MHMFLALFGITEKVSALLTRLHAWRAAWRCCAPWKGRAIPCGARLANRRARRTLERVQLRFPGSM